MSIVIRQATPREAIVAAEILQEAVRWLDETGQPMWKDGEVSAAKVSENVQQGLFYLVWMDGLAAGTFKLQMEDELFWPDIPMGESVFLHRLAVCRKFAGKGIPQAIIEQAKKMTTTAGRRFLRLDCEAHRAKLCALYEKLGFVRHSETQAGPYYVRRFQCEVRSQ